ncbi:hypothetical protein M153_2570006060 [Pseudoloma neurophilia]|uniref:Uncharacterized protein n=1 Tax=Pseudoloma neurophilia TaxID=146866 RepID=A0A0R0LZB5_9MICR|nr:hypothetical protein M153_2570006060 [Pseudoloma neurophilia]
MDLKSTQITLIAYLFKSNVKDNLPSDFLVKRIGRSHFEELFSIMLFSLNL